MTNKILLYTENTTGGIWNSLSCCNCKSQCFQEEVQTWGTSTHGNPPPEFCNFNVTKALKPEHCGAVWKSDGSSVNTVLEECVWGPLRAHCNGLRSSCILLPLIVNELSSSAVQHYKFALIYQHQHAG